ncbi:MAG: glycosyltransferase family 4 protein [Hyphomonadaceae bacterium]|nr:glycosyltransferase family 4 protein [Hyphomonadaceae bacterium]
MTVDRAPQGLKGPSSFAAPLRRAAMIGNFPPRRCGIATFTHDAFTSLRDQSPTAEWHVVAMNDTGSTYDYPEDVTHVLPQDDPKAYVRIADVLNLSGVEVVIVQHEFGIFGGEAGSNLLLLMRRLRMPVIVWLHTVLEHPTPVQKRVMDEILHLAAGAIVMTWKGAEIIQRVHRVGPSKVHVIPHGAPERPFASTEKFKAALGFAGQKLLMTFGLISPNKGVETIIRALPGILSQHPDTHYLVVGATHPHLLARDGETYRDSLVALAESLGVAEHFGFINRFVDQQELVDLLQAADIYVTPYLTEAQITSGTLSYAIALGKPVISTPYWHATEALADGVGIICNFHDSEAFGREITSLLSNQVRREAMARRAWKAGEPSRWRKVAASSLELAIACRDAGDKRAQASIRTLSRPSLGAVRHMFDDCGIFQHARFRVPDRRHGYCSDDNARALTLFARLSLEGDNGDPDARLTYSSAAFISHAWNPDTGRFRNFMGFNRTWLDEGGSDDCCARSFESLCLAGGHATRPDLRDWAQSMLVDALPHIGAWSSVRARALLIKSLLLVDLATPDPVKTTAFITQAADAMLALLAQQSEQGGEWFEPGLTYDNARLPEALILAGHRLKRQDWLDAGLTTLAILMRRQRSPQGWFSPIATSSFAQCDADHPCFDQQPIEALATVDACVAAFQATREEAWASRAEAAFMWFAGQNDHGLALAMPADGGCFDGLTVHGANQNQGAESILSYHLASASMRDLLRSRSGP